MSDHTSTRTLGGNCPVTHCLYSRAKIKMLAKKSLETGEDIDSIPESMRQYLQLQAMESGKGFSYFGRTGLLPYGHQGALGGEQGGQGKVCMSPPFRLLVVDHALTVSQ